MVNEPTTLQTIRKVTALMLVAAAVLGACAPAVSPAQVQQQIQDAVAATVAAQNEMSTQVALTVTAMAPVPSSTPFPSPTLVDLPTLTPIIATVTPFVVQSGGSGGYVPQKAKYACDAYTVKPKDGTQFKPGDPFDIRWIITNTGTEDMRAGLDFEYLSGPHLTTAVGGELPRLKPGQSYQFDADANAPLEKGDYVMTWKVEGGLCYPYVAIHSGRPGLDP